MMSSITAVIPASLVNSAKKKNFNFLAHKMSIAELSLVNTGYVIINNSILRSAKLLFCGSCTLVFQAYSLPYFSVKP